MICHSFSRSCTVPAHSENQLATLQRSGKGIMRQMFITTHLTHSEKKHYTEVYPSLVSNQCTSYTSPSLLRVTASLDKWLLHLPTASETGSLYRLPSILRKNMATERYSPLGSPSSSGDSLRIIGGTVLFTPETRWKWDECGRLQYWRPLGGGGPMDW